MIESMNSLSNASIGVGFGTAGLGGSCYGVVTWALQFGFRKFDTAEADWWYDQASVGRALKDYFKPDECEEQGLEISTKIPPWSLTSVDDIRTHAAQSRAELVGFCNDTTVPNADHDVDMKIPFPMDVYYIHAPKCWPGWHYRCDDAPPTLDLRTAWMAMEAVVGLDHSAKRIGLSNVYPNDLLDIIRFVEQRVEAGEVHPPPRKPDVVQAFADPISPSYDLRKLCEQNGIEFVSYSTLGTQHRGSDQNPVLTSPIVRDIAMKHSRSVAEVVLSWALQNNMSVIPRSRKRHHIEELARLLEDPKFLDAEDLKAIDSMSEAIKDSEL